MATLPAGPLPSSSKWGKLRGQLILQGLLTIFITPPHTLEKKSLPVTWLSLPVPLWFQGCLLLVATEIAARGHYPGSCGEGAALPPGPQLGRDLRGALAWGLFQAECVWSLMPQILLGPPPPQTSVCGKEY